MFVFLGDNTSFVTAHLSKEGILTAVIKTANETYYIEVSFKFTFITFLFALSFSLIGLSCLSFLSDFLITV